MKDDAHKIIGKTINGVIIKKTKLNRSPHCQLFLVFDDGTSYEFYSDRPIRPAGGIEQMDFDHVIRYMGDQMKVAFTARLDAESGLVVFGSSQQK